MRYIHEELCRRFAWYSRWHQDSHASTVAWCIFLLVALFYTSTLVNYIVDTQYGHEAALQVSLVKKSFDRPAENSSTTARLLKVNNTALSRANEHAQAAPGFSNTALETLKVALTERQAALKELALTHPQEVRRFVFDEQALQTIPNAARNLVEKSFEQKGVYEIHIAESFTEGDVPYEMYYLNVGDGKQYRLALSEEEAYRLEPNVQVTIVGVIFDNDLVLPLEFEESDGEGEVLGASTIKKVAVVAFNFRNNTAQPFSVDEIRRRVFTNANGVAAYYNEVSYGQWGIESKNRPDGDVYGWFTIDADANGTCGYTTWASLANQAVTASGGNLSGYTNIQYVFPVSNTGCSWAGVATLGGSNSWVRAESLNTLVSGHELGHNFGFHHASSYGCPVAQSTIGMCTPSEYADRHDIMGNGTARHTNNYNKSKYWIGASQIVTATQSGTYTIEPLETSSSGVKVVRIKRPFAVSSMTISDGYYYLEFRTPSGTFDNYYVGDPVVNGLTVRLANGNYLTGGQKTYWVNTYAPGSSLVDAEGGITITPRSVSATGIVVDVSMQPVLCTRNNPTVAMTPSGQWGTPGNSLTYTLTVKNNDSDGCGQSTFTGTPTLPDGFAQSPTSPAIVLNPGEQKSVTITISAPLAATPASYGITETVKNNASPSNSASASVNFNIAALDAVPPVITITSPKEGAILTANKVTVTASATDESGISLMEILIDGKSVRTCRSATTCSYSWNTAKVVKGAHAITVVAVDNSTQRNRNQSSVTVTK